MKFPWNVIPIFLEHICPYQKPKQSINSFSTYCNQGNLKFEGVIAFLTAT